MKFTAIVIFLSAFIALGQCLCFQTCTCPRYPAFFKTRRNHRYFGGAILGGGMCPLRKKLLLGPISHRRRVTYGYL